MNKHIKRYVLTLLLLSFFNGISQEQLLEKDYLEKENQRLEKAQQTEKDIENYINNNLSKYKLTEDKIKEIKNAPSCTEDGPLQFGKKIEKQKSDLQEVFLETKKSELRKLYFQNNPESENVFKSIPINTRAISCVNGGFEDGAAGYTFRSTNNASAWLNIRNDVIPMPNNFVNVQFNNNNFPVSLVPPGNVIVGNTNLGINTVRTGNRAIKLNPTQFPTNGSYDITTLERLLPINDEYFDVNFSLIMHDPAGHGIFDNFFRITVYDVNNNIVDRVMITADPANCLFNQFQVNSNRILYTSWVCARLNVGQILNQNGRLEIMIADCGWGGHFSTVYIDDICGAESNCANPLQGSINLNPLNNNICPSLPMQVCGTYQLPPNSTLGSLTLNVLDFNNQNVIHSTILTPSSLTPNTFCFEINQSHFPSLTGQYEFRVNANFIVNCPVAPFNWAVSDTSTNIGADIDFNGQLTINNILINGQIVSWDNNADSYLLEFIADGRCCGVNVTYDFQPTYYTYVSSSNQFNGLNIIGVLEQKCFRWRGRPNNSCGEWSEWCCLTSYTNRSNIVNNPFEPTCHPEPPCDLPYQLTINDNINGVTQTHRADGIIIANNTIENGADVTYIAGLTILLQPNFYAKNNALFLAKIEDCIATINSPDQPKNAVFEQKGEVKPKIDIEQINEGDTVKIYPNPASSFVNLISEKVITSIEIVNTNGKIVMANKGIVEKTFKYDLIDLSDGLYFVRILLQDGTTEIKKLMIKK